MSDILSSEKKKNGNRLIRKSTRVDLTPMVDLGFLLITFFVFTTTMSTTTAMGMVTPKDVDTTNDLVCESCVITVLPTANNKLYYYEGSEKNARYKTTDYSAAGLRALLMNKKASAKAIHKEAILIIKPGATSSFKNLINIIDESNICMYKRYYLDKLPIEEEKKLQLIK
ncbi:MAG: biopolymer transporter ExbD [Ferruginibacter sp.]|nr:biopolymer transporter ExbD [Ferruginibacter sp.]